MPLENTLAISEFTFRIRKSPDHVAVEEPHRFNTFIDRMTIGARVAVNSGAHPSRDTGHRLQPAQPFANREINQRLQLRSSGGADLVALASDLIAGKAQE